MRRLLPLILTLILPAVVFAQSNYELRAGQISMGGGSAASQNYTLKSVSGLSVTGRSSGGAFTLTSGMPYGSITFGIEESPIERPPAIFKLYPMAPNPFRNHTRIIFSIPSKTDVAISVYDVSGRLVWSVFMDDVEPGQHSVGWNGTDVNGHHLPGGMYILRFRAGEFDEVRKFLILR